MGSSSLPLKFAFVLTLSLAVAFVPHSPRRRLGVRSLRCLSSSVSPKATVSDLLALLGPLGPPHGAESMDSTVAAEIRSCFKFLAPRSSRKSRRSLRSTADLASVWGKGRDDDVDGLILSPPDSVLELARIGVDSGADPAAIHRALDPTMIPVPDVEGSVEDRCELTRTPYGRRFVDEGLNSYIEFLFETIMNRGPEVGLNVSLSRFDLFHGHVFLARDSGRLGILFHAREYPAYDKEVFPYNMGYCQIGSNVAYDDSMNLRNILWLAPLPSNSTNTWLAPGVLVVLDANPNGIIYRDLIPDYVNYARTLGFWASGGGCELPECWR